MLLSDVFEQLAYGELSHMYASAEGDTDTDETGIRPDKRRQIMAHVKMGLTELHKRFLLREGRVTVELQDNKRTYVLDTKYLRDDDHPDRYLIDKEDQPFSDNVFKIERVYDEKGEELPLNIMGDPESAHTPGFKTLVLPDGLKGDMVEVVYRADHPPLKPYLVEAAPQLVILDLPTTHMEALLMFIASRTLNPLGAGGEFHEGNMYAGKFERACALLETLNFEQGAIGSDTRFYDRGWC